MDVSITYQTNLREALVPDGEVHGANMGPTWVLSAPDWPHVGPWTFAVRVSSQKYVYQKRSGASTNLE